MADERKTIELPFSPEDVKAGRVSGIPDGLNMHEEACRLEVATQLFERFCDDLKDHPPWARTRLVSGIQIALRDAAAYGATTPVQFYDDNVEPKARPSSKFVGSHDVQDGE